MRVFGDKGADEIWLSLEWNDIEKKVNEMNQCSSGVLGIKRDDRFCFKEKSHVVKNKWKTCKSCFLFFLNILTGTRMNFFAENWVPEVGNFLSVSVPNISVDQPLPHRRPHRNGKIGAIWIFDGHFITSTSKRKSPHTFQSVFSWDTVMLQCMSGLFTILNLKQTIASCVANSKKGNSAATANNDNKQRQQTSWSCCMKIQNGILTRSRHTLAHARRNSAFYIIYRLIWEQRASVIAGH